MKQAATQTETMVETYQTPDILDQTIAVTEEKLKAQTGCCRVPDGWELLPAGITRKIRVNRQWVQFDRGKPILVFRGEETTPQEYSQIEILGSVRMVSSRVLYGCSSRGSVYMETESAILVKR